MAAHIIDGRAIAHQLRRQVTLEVQRLRQMRAVTPGLAVIVVGEDPASQVYVATKAKQTRETGMLSSSISCPRTRLRQAVGPDRRAQRTPGVDGILVQLPLPEHIVPRRVIEAIDPAKDVDGFHPLNVGRLATGARRLCPVRPRGACPGKVRAPEPRRAWRR